MLLLPCDRGASALEALEEARDVRRGVHATEEMDMGSHHPELEEMGALLPRDSTQEFHEKPREPRVNERGPVAGSPNDVAVEAVKHTGELMRSVSAFSISSLQGGSIKRAGLKPPVHGQGRAAA
jgi:hypothetical protein